MKLVEDKCSKCGLCCFWIDTDNIAKPCKYLSRLSNGKTFCKIYSRRLKKVIAIKQDGTKVYCFYRMSVNKHYSGCKYNEDINIEE